MVAFDVPYYLLIHLIIVRGIDLNLNNIEIKCHKHRKRIVCSRKEILVECATEKHVFKSPKSGLEPTYIHIHRKSLPTYSVFSFCCLNPKLTPKDYTEPIVLTFAQNLYFRCARSYFERFGKRTPILTNIYFSPKVLVSIHS